MGQGYWKNHEQWPVNQLQLGNRTYNRQELQSILQQPVRGNGLVQLAHQEITAKLNIAHGADGSCVEQTLAAADASIGNMVIPPVGQRISAPQSLRSHSRPLQRRRVVRSTVRVESSAKRESDSYSEAASDCATAARAVITTN